MLCDSLNRDSAHKSRITNYAKSSIRRMTKFEFEFRTRSVPSPNHGDRSREAAAHVECEEFFRVLDLPRAGLVRELLIRLENLPNAGRPHGVTVGDQAAARVYRDLERPFEFFRRTCGKVVAPLFTSSTPLPDSARPRIS